jgi:Nuclease A inhibitor-like protein
MRPEQIFASLELLVDRLPFDLPYHEDGGYVYPFIWDRKVQAEFNIFNLYRSNSWVKLTDSALVIKQWEGLGYAQVFNDFSLNDGEIGAWQNGIKSLAQSLNYLNNLQAYDFQFQSDVPPNGIILGQTNEGNWIGITSAVYVASHIPNATLDFTPDTRLLLDIAADRADILTRIINQLSSFQNIKMSGDFGGGYPYSYTHQMVYGIGATRELAWGSTLQASGMLAQGKLNTIYHRSSDLLDRYCDDGEERINDVFDRYKNIVKLLRQELSEPSVYRISSWNSENIYIAGEIKNYSKGDRIGIYIKSNFVYNP